MSEETRKDASGNVRRYCVISDDSGHEYLCPVDRRDEALRWLCAIDAYYADDAEVRDSAVDLDGPDYITRIDGSFTFTDPRFT